MAVKNPNGWKKLPDVQKSGDDCQLPGIVKVFHGLPAMSFGTQEYQLSDKALFVKTLRVPRAVEQCSALWTYCQLLR